MVARYGIEQPSRLVFHTIAEGNTLTEKNCTKWFVDPNQGYSIKLRMLYVAVMCCLCSVLTSTTQAAVNLELRPVTTLVAEGSTVDVEVYAVADSEVNEEISALDIVITWDSDVLGGFVEIRDGAFNWIFSNSFMDDSQVDGLNDSRNDGDALFQNVTFSPAVVTPKGLLVTTLRFATIARGRDARVSIISNLGRFSQTKVFKFNKANVEITGTLGQAAVSVLCPACLIVPNVKMLAGRVSAVFVSGEIVDQLTKGVSIVAEISPDLGSMGSITFTPAPPVDITEMDDPWPGMGAFVKLDTDSSFFLERNGSASDNGILIDSLLSYAGTLSRFPIIADSQAMGFWTVRLTIPGGFSFWEGVTTTLFNGTVQIVEPGDGDGDGAIDTLEYSRLQRCFTGSVDFADPPAYTVTPELNCGVYDVDGDGDVDGLDYEEFNLRFNGPGL